MIMERLNKYTLLRNFAPKRCGCFRIALGGVSRSCSGADHISSGEPDTGIGYVWPGRFQSKKKDCRRGN
jgi:hypothetical protein